MLTLYQDNGETRKKIVSSDNVDVLRTYMLLKIDFEGVPSNQLFILDDSMKPYYMMNKLDLEY